MASKIPHICCAVLLNFCFTSVFNGVEGLVPELKVVVRNRQRKLQMTTIVSPEYSSFPLPPPFPEMKLARRIPTQGEKRREVIEDRNRKWRGQSIPDTIPKLSEVMKKIENSGNDWNQTETATSKNAKKQQSRPLEERTKRPPTDLTPWKAGYYTSLKSQKLIKDAAINAGRKHPIERATAVLEAFLSLPQAKCNAANLVCALTLSAKVIGRETNDNFRSLLYRTTNILHQMLEDKSLSVRQLCNVAWALAKHYDRDDRLLPAVPEPAALSSDAIMFGQAETWDLRNDLAGCPAQRVDKAVDEIARQLTCILQDDSRAGKEGELCMACWAYGVLRRRRRPAGWQHGPQLSKLALPTKDKQNKIISSNFIKFEQWSSHNVSKAETVCDSDVAGVTGTLLDTIGRALCHLIAPTNLAQQDGASLSTYRRVRLCTWSELANVAWSFASHGRSSSCDAHALLTAIASEASRRLNESGVEAKQALSRDIAQIIWSLGTLQADNFRMGDNLIQFVDSVAVFTHGVNEFKKWSCTDIVQVVLSLAHARLDELPMLRSLYTEAFRRLELEDAVMNNLDQGRKMFFTWEISVLLWAQAKFYLNESHGGIFDAFSRKAISSIKTALQQGSSFRSIGIGPQEQANLAWSLTVLELYNIPDAAGLLSAIFVEASSFCQEQGVIQLEHAHQLWQALFLLEDDCPSCVVAVPGWFRDYLRDKWCVEKARPKISSARHLSLSKTLSSMGVAHFNEHEEDIDVAIILKVNASWTHETETSSIQDGVRVAVEFDGPNHFTRQRLSIDGSRLEPPRALGHTVLKYRLLKKQGWTVVRVPYYEFDKIPFWASMERQRYLQRLLKTHGNLQFSHVDVSAYKAPVPDRGSRFD